MGNDGYQIQLILDYFGCL